MLRNISDDELLKYSKRLTQEYKIVQGGNSKELEGNVNAFLKAGWQLYGGISISPTPVFYQALVREVVEK